MQDLKLINQDQIEWDFDDDWGIAKIGPEVGDDND